MRLIVVLLLAVTALSLPVQATDYEEAIKTLTEIIINEMDEYEIIGLSIALVDGQEVIWSEGFGYADQEQEIPMTPATLIRVGSISKLFTATAVMRLAEIGMLDIDSELQRYLPSFNMKSLYPDAGPITLRNMMTHHSGLPSEWFPGMITEEPYHFSELVRRLAGTYAAFPSELIHTYSNIAYTLLGCVIEKVTERDFIAYMEEELLLPMGMTSSSFRLQQDKERMLSSSYHYGERAEHFPMSMVPAGSLYSNGVDMARFIKTILNGGSYGDNRIIGTETLAEMFSPQNEHIAFDFDYKSGLGWVVNVTEKEGLRLRHGGTDASFNSHVILLPDHNLGVVVMGNSTPAYINIRYIAQEAIRVAFKAKTETKIETVPQTPSFMRMSTAELKQFEGYYAGMSTLWDYAPLGLFRVQVWGWGLRMDLPGLSLFLSPNNEGRFSLRFLLLGLIPIRHSLLAGHEFIFTEIDGVQVLTWYENGYQTFLGSRLARAGVSPAWRARLGQYEIANVGLDVPFIENLSLGVKYGFLVLHMTVDMLQVRDISISDISLPLRALSDTKAVIMGIGRSMGDVLEVVQKEGREYIFYGGYLLRKIEDD